MTKFFWYVEELFFLSSQVVMIKQGVEDRTIGIPFVALVLNLSWTCLFSFFVKREKIYSIDQISFFLYLFILLQALYYGGPVGGGAAGPPQTPQQQQRDGGYRQRKQLVYCTQLAVWSVVSLNLIRALIDGVGRSWSHNQLFYMIQMATSVLFPHMLLSRGNTGGQHASVPVLRWVGMAFGWLYQRDAISGWCTIGSFFAVGFYSYTFYLCHELPVDFHDWRGLFLETSSGPPAGYSVDPLPMVAVNDHKVITGEYSAPRMNVPLVDTPGV